MDAPQDPQCQWEPQRAPGGVCAADKGTHLQLGLEEELLWALRAVVDLVLLSVHSKDVLLQLVGLDENWTWTWTWPSGGQTLGTRARPTRAAAPHHSHVGITQAWTWRPNNGLLETLLAHAREGSSQ